MNEITVKLRNKALEDFKPIVEEMASSGCSKDQIVRAFQSHIKTKTTNFYTKQSDLKSFADIYDSEKFERADSKAETIFYQLMQDSGVKFEFQRIIGPYTVDYLVMGFLIIEIDGQQHNKEHDDKRDNYMHRMGYKIIRIPTWVLFSCPEAAIDEIKELIKIKRVK